MLTGENGIFTKAQTSSDQTKQKGVEEKVKLAVAGSWGNDGKINIEELKKDSLEWGNYYNSTFDITKGRYSTDNGVTYTEVIDKFTKPSNTNVLLTTGETQRNCALNIYDLAGNEWEWTLEKSTDAGYPGSCRGGRSYSSGSTAPVAFRIISVANGSNEGLGVRFSIY